MALIFKNGLFTNVKSRGSVEVIYSVTIFNLLAAGSTTTIVSGVAGQMIRLLSVTAASQTSSSTYALFNSNTLTRFGVNVPGNALPTPFYENKELGLCELDLGEPLVLEVGASSGGYFTTKFIIYAP